MSDLTEEPDLGESDPPASSTFDGEDFLFHLYRGSELLQDNCIPEAKEELEAALRMQPRDVEGQGLLGVVYFRLGHYQRAISIYEDLVRAAPGDVTPKINLALCYLKTGQFNDSRSRLEEIIQVVPNHTRAWGYLGLVFQRLGDYAKARAAFDRAEQPRLARRMQRLTEEAAGSARDSEAPPGRAEMRAAAADAVQELHDDDAPHPFSLAGSDDEPSAPSRSGRWRAVELGEEPLPPVSRPMRPAPREEPSSLPPARDRPALSSPLPARELASRLLVPLEASAGIRLVDERTAVVNVGTRFSARVSRIRAMLSRAGDFRSEPLTRRVRGRDTEDPLGGASAPIQSLAGVGHLVLSSHAARKLAAILPDGDFLYVREEHVVGFEPSLNYENGRLGIGDGEFVPMLQLSGEGAVIVEARDAFEAIEVTADGGAVVRAEAVLGWTGRLFPRAVPTTEAPGGVPGLVAFSGSGGVFLHGG